MDQLTELLGVELGEFGPSYGVDCPIYPNTPVAILGSAG